MAQYNEKLNRLNENNDCSTIMERLKALDEQLSTIKTQVRQGDPRIRLIGVGSVLG